MSISLEKTSAALPSISMVTCSYQQAAYLETTLRSVLTQDYAKLEYIVIDGGSTDGSAEILRRYQSQLAYSVSEKDAGQTDALIKGFNRASGEIMGWLCSDDLLLPNALNTVGQFFAEHPEVGAVYGDALWIDGDGKFIRPKKEIPFNRFIFLYDHNYVPQPSMFWRRSLYEAIGGLDRNFSLAMDGDLWDRFSRRLPIAHLPSYLSCMRFYQAQKTRSLRPQALQENTTIRTRDAHRLGEPLYPLLHAIAKTTRCLIKARRGGYNARVMPEHLAWLETFGTTAESL